MSIETKTITRKITVCLKKGCMSCPLNVYAVPDECEFAMKHLLCTEEEGVVIDMPRRSGKTTRILNMAIELLNQGQPVLLFTPTVVFGNNIQRQMMGSGLEIASVGGWDVSSRSGTARAAGVQNVQKALHGRKGPVMVLSDEVHPWIVKAVKKLKRHRFVLGFYSKQG